MKNNIWTTLVEQEQFIWNKYINHPFLNLIKNNSLDQKVFTAFLEEDYCYLQDYTRAWMLLYVKAQDKKETKLILENLMSIPEDEQKLILTLSKHSKKDMSKLKPSLFNVAYTSYFYNVFVTGDFLDLLVALAPCMVGYIEALNLINLQDENLAVLQNDTYKKWIASYQTKNCQENCLQLVNLINQYDLSCFKSNKFEQLKDIFCNSVNFEIKFWDHFVDKNNQVKKVTTKN